jgi:hypothetical protein
MVLDLGMYTNKVHSNRGMMGMGLVALHTIVLLLHLQLHQRFSEDHRHGIMEVCVSFVPQGTRSATLVFATFGIAALVAVPSCMQVVHGA